MAREILFEGFSRNEILRLPAEQIEMFRTFPTLNSMKQRVMICGMGAPLLPFLRSL